MLFGATKQQLKHLYVFLFENNLKTKGKIFNQFCKKKYGLAFNETYAFFMENLRKIYILSQFVDL